MQQFMHVMRVGYCVRIKLNPESNFLVPISHLIIIISLTVQSHLKRCTTRADIEPERQGLPFSFRIRKKRSWHFMRTLIPLSFTFDGAGRGVDEPRAFSLMFSTDSF